MKAILEFEVADVRKALQMYLDKYHNNPPDITQRVILTADPASPTGYSELQGLKIVDTYPPASLGG